MRALFMLPFWSLLILSTPASSEPGSMGEPKMLIHGNYCGPGNNAPLPPIDALDAACARHDACTPNHAMPSHTCNMRLQQEADAVLNDPHQPIDLRLMAGFVASGAAALQIADPPGPGPGATPGGGKR